MLSKYYKNHQTCQALAAYTVQSRLYKSGIHSYHSQSKIKVIPRWLNTAQLFTTIQCQRSIFCIEIYQEHKCKKEVIFSYTRNLSITYFDTILISLSRYLTCRILFCNSSTVSKSSPMIFVINSISPSYIPISFNIFLEGELI